MQKLKKFFTYGISCLLCLPLTVSAQIRYVNCGKIQSLPYKILQLSNLAVKTTQAIIPTILVIMGSVDFVKAISSQKEDDMKKAQSNFIRKLILGALVFFLFAIVKLVLSIIGGNKDSILECVNCFINNAKKCYK